MPEYEEHKKKDNSRENVRPAEPSMLKAHFAFLILPVFALFLLVFGISFALYGKNSNSSPEELDNPEESVPPDLLETFTWLPYKVKKGIQSLKLHWIFRFPWMPLSLQTELPMPAP